MEGLGRCNSIGRKNKKVVLTPTVLGVELPSEQGRGTTRDKKNDQRRGYGSRKKLWWGSTSRV